MPKDTIPNVDEEVKEVVETKKHRIFEVKPDSKTKALDTFFRFVLTNELPAGITATSTDKQMGINNNILKNLAVWLCQKSYDEEKLKEEIKPIYDLHNWPFLDLLGWFKKAVKGDIKDKLILEKLFKENKFDAIMHFAGLISVEESTKNPDIYYQNNVIG